jgi:AAA+ superfamily predicted ATPase
VIWLYANDISHYHGIDALEQEFGLEEILVLPSKQQVADALKSKKRFGVISFELPMKSWRSFFVIKELPNIHSVLTYQDEIFGVSEEEAISSKLGIRISKPKLSFKDLGGAKALRQWAQKIEILKSKNIAIKPVFLLGMPGVGKSYFVECYAGEIDVVMVELNLSMIMESAEPVYMLHQVFKYLSDSKLECVVRIDEIEQMLGSKVLLGQMLTILNDLNMPGKYQLNGIIIATSNNIKEIVLEAPQFFRHGRWNEKFFANYPLKSDALDVYELFAQGMGIDRAMLELIYIKADIKYRGSNIQEGRSVYTQAEIKYLIERLHMYSSIDERAIDQEIEYVKPQQFTASRGISKMLSDTSNLHFEEI